MFVLILYVCIGVNSKNDFMRRAADLHIQSAQTSHPWSACAFQAAMVASLVAFHTSATGDHVHGLWLVIHYCHDMAWQCNGNGNGNSSI